VILPVRSLDVAAESRFTPAPTPEEAKPMAVDIKKLFDEELPAALAKNADAAKGIGAKYQMNISGPTGGEWNIDVSASGPFCKPGSGPSDCTISISDEDFQKLVENPQANGMQLFFAGKLKVTGNQMLAMKLQKLFGFR
jgi:putative sterol carrier protein